MKKLYNQPEVNVAQINTMSMICVSDTVLEMNNIPTNEQW